MKDIIDYHEIIKELKMIIDNYHYLMVLIIFICTIIFILFILNKLYKQIKINKEIEIEKIELKKYLDQTEKLSVLGKTTAGITHDFNNTLSLISTCNSLILDELNQKNINMKFIEEMTINIEKGILNGKEIIKQILKFAKGKIDFRQVSLKKEFQQNFKLMKFQIPNNVETIINLDSDSLVTFDTVNFSRVINNLLDNAIHALRDKDKGIITAHLIDISKDFVRLELTDNGCGMDKETLTKIFDPYFTTKKHGNGYGLSNVDTFMKESKGKIEAFSEVGKGTTFRLLFPITK